MKQFIATLAMLTALLAGAGSSWSAKPLLTIVFSGNSEGAIRPCSVCGGKIIGGLSRRATYINNLRQITGKTVPVIAISGGWEFLPEDGRQSKQVKIKALAEAYSRIKFDLGLLIPNEATAIRKAGASLPSQWLTVSRVTQAELPLPEGQKVGFVLLPPLTPKKKDPPKDLIGLISKAVEHQRKTASLVVAVSPWGYFAELTYLRTLDALLPDILLGAGPGPGFKGMMAGGGKTYWMRAYGLGKALNSLEILEWPGRDSGFRWRDEGDIRSLNIGLTDQVREDSAISVLFEGMDMDTD